MSVYKLNPSTDFITDRGCQTSPLPLDHEMDHSGVQSEQVQHQTESPEPVQLETELPEPIQESESPEPEPVSVMPQPNIVTSNNTSISATSGSNATHARFFCTVPHCQKSYTTKSDLRRHVDSVHAGKTFSCEICKLKFTLKKNLVVHMKLHDSTSGHVCQMCGKSCQDQRSLASHLAGHSGEKNFQCTNSGCTKKYQNQSGLRKHLKVCGKSLEERQIYSCSQCPQKCVSKDVLKQHICTVHGEKGKFICQQCGYAMNSRGALKSHKCKK